MNAARFPQSVSSDDASSSSSSAGGPSPPASPPASPPPTPLHHAGTPKCQTLPPLPEPKPAPADAGDISGSRPAVQTSPSAAHGPSRPPSSVARPAASLEDLVQEKQAMLASFEAQFNRKILSRHRELVEEHASKSDDNLRLAEEVERLKGALEQQRFSHEVEISVQKKMVKDLEEDLQKERVNNALREIYPQHSAQSSARAAERVVELEEELRRERGLRIEQLKSLEQLHVSQLSSQNIFCV